MIHASRDQSPRPSAIACLRAMLHVPGSWKSGSIHRRAIQRWRLIGSVRSLALCLAIASLHGCGDDVAVLAPVGEMPTGAATTDFEAPEPNPPIVTPNPETSALVERTVTDAGWSGSSVNAAIFRRDPLVTHGDVQYVGFYDQGGDVVLGHRKLGDTQFRLEPTRFEGNVEDGHNVISLGVDGEGVLHIAWDHHRDALNYARGVSPGTLSLGQPESMIGRDEDEVTYPEFHALPDGDLLFLYRDGGSGRGNLVVNRYRVQSRQWERVSYGLLDGEKQRNAYWQFHVARNGTWHLSWTWRESADVATNHDLYYMRSRDDGVSWESTSGAVIETPVREGGGELVRRIPMNSNLINQTSIWAGDDDVPYIATYFRRTPHHVTQIEVLYPKGGQWISKPVTDRTDDFELSGGGTRSLPLSRPRILGRESVGGGSRLYVLYRDEAFGNRIVVASRSADEASWKRQALPGESLDRWEPALDSRLWQRDRRLHLFVQRVHQRDGDAPVVRDATPIHVLEVELD